MIIHNNKVYWDHIFENGGYIKPMFNDSQKIWSENTILSHQLQISYSSIITITLQELLKISPL